MPTPQQLMTEPFGFHEAIRLAEANIQRQLRAEQRAERNQRRAQIDEQLRDDYHRLIRPAR